MHAALIASLQSHHNLVHCEPYQHVMACSSKLSGVWACGCVEGGGGGGVANLAVFIVTVKSGRREDESQDCFAFCAVMHYPDSTRSRLPLHSAPAPEPVPLHHNCSC